MSQERSLAIPGDGSFAASGSASQLLRLLRKEPTSAAVGVPTCVSGAGVDGSLGDLLATSGVAACSHGGPRSGGQNAGPKTGTKLRDALFDTEFGGPGSGPQFGLTSGAKFGASSGAAECQRAYYSLLL